jgi:hypothetical protein
VARRRVPHVASLPKHGFGVPFDTWVDEQFRRRFQDELCGAHTKVNEFLDPRVFRPLVAAFCREEQFANLTRQGLYQRALMLMALELGLRHDADTGHS